MQLQAHLCRPVSIIGPRRCHFICNSHKPLACTQVIFRDIPLLTAACECLRDLAEKFFERVKNGTPVTVEGSTRNLTSVRKAIPSSIECSVSRIERNGVQYYRIASHAFDHLKRRQNPQGNGPRRLVARYGRELWNLW